MPRLTYRTLLLVVLLFPARTVLGQQVDLLTGRLDYGVSLGSVSVNDISLGVSLRAQGDALRVPEGEGTCGMGWSLSAGGSVSRQVRGLPDEVTNGWKNGSGIATAVNNFTPVADEDYSNCTDANETTDYNAILALTGNELFPTKDTEPDIFYVSAPGLSAQFVFGTDGQPKQLTHQDLKIETVFPNSITITTAQGMKYVFDVVETIKRSGICKADAGQVNTLARYYGQVDQVAPPPEIMFTGRWHLSSITSATTGTNAVFGYTTQPEGRHIEYVSGDSLNYIQDIIEQPRRLATISLATYAVNLTWLNDLLSKVSLSESETGDLQEYSLEYASGGSGQHYKSFLTRVQQVNNCVPSATLEFEYKDITYGIGLAPWWQYNTRQDFFGFYNGRPANINRPKLYFYNSETDGRRLRVTPIPGLTATSVTSGDDRSVNDTVSGFGALTRIKFPTGGFVQIDYEPNRYMDASTSQELEGAGVRVKRITRNGSTIAFGGSLDTPDTSRAIVTTYDYKLSSGSSSGVLVSPINLGFVANDGVRKSVSLLGDDPVVLYTRVSEIIPDRGKRVYEYAVPGVFPETSNGAWAASRSKIARKPSTPCVSAGSIKAGHYIFPYAPSTNSTKRGMLTKVSEFTQSGTLIRDRTETTQELSVNGGSMKALRFERINNIYHYAQYTILTGRVEVPYQTVTRESSEKDPGQWMQTTTTYTFNANGMLAQVSTALPDGSSTRRVMRYAKDYASLTTPASTDTTAKAIKKLNDQNRHGQLLEEVAYQTVAGGTETTTGAALTLFREFSTDRVLPYYVKTAYPGVAVQPATATTTAYTPDTDYYLVNTFKEYDQRGRVLTALDERRNSSGTHYLANQSTVAFQVSQARAQQCIYEGFEGAGTFGLSVSGTGAVVDTDARTGEKAMRFTNATAKLVSSATSPIQKGATIYRMACWAKGATGKTITFTVKQGASTAVGQLTVSANNAYAYLEGTLSVSSLTGPFTLEVNTSADASNAVFLDDVIFVPQHARVSWQTTKPFKGVTSTSDDRGRSVKNVYDEGGRLLHTFDNDRNMISKNEYLLKESMTPGVNALFSMNVSKIEAGSAVTFTAGATCGSASGVTHSWQVDGTTRSTASTLVWTFLPGTHTVTHTLNDPAYGAFTITETYCVVPGTAITVQKFDANGNPYTGPIDCNFHGDILFTASQPSYWYKYDAGNWVPLFLGSDPPVISIEFFEPASTTLKAVPANPATYDKCQFNPATYIATAGYNYVNNPNCN